MDRGREPKIGIIVPALNEEKTIADTIARCSEAIPDAKVVVVDGMSQDATMSIAADMGATTLYERHNVGKGHALRLAFDVLDLDYYLCIDADGSMRPEELRLIKDKLEGGFALAKGSRVLPEGGSEDLTFIRDLGNRAFVKMVNILYGAKYTDMCYGLFGLTRETLERISLQANGFDFETELCVLAAKAGLPVAEVPSMELSRKNGHGKLRTFSDGRKILSTIIKLLRPGS